MYRRLKWNVEVRVIGLGEDVGCAELLLLQCASMTASCSVRSFYSVVSSLHLIAFTLFCAITPAFLNAIH